ncbi:MAG: hypothetical protein V1822_01305, partial [Candidatus Micrarchaeota archaeon]
EALQQKFRVPISLQGHMVTNIGDKFLLEGHIPASAVASLLQGKQLPAGFILYNDGMEADPPGYLIYDGTSTISCTAGQAPYDCYQTSQKTPFSLQGQNPQQKISSISSPSGGDASPLLPALMIFASILTTGYYVASKRY